MANLRAMLRANRPLALALGLFVALLAAWLVVDRPVKAERRLEERIASGKPVPHHFYVPVYLWRGLTLNIALAAALAGACWIAGRKLDEVPALQEDASRRYHAVEKGILSLIVLFAAVQGWQRLDHSTWGDEDYTVKTYIEDQVTELQDGKLQFTKTPWQDVLWHGKRPNNHFGFTALSRLSHDLFFTPGAGPVDPFFSERWVRLPAYVAGLLSILAIAWMARVWGWGHGLWLLLLYYVIHPWFVRFGTDARGYSIVLLGLPLVVGLAGRALQSGRWRWWLLLALAQAFTFWCYWGVFYVLLPFQVGLLVAILTDRTRSVPDRRILTARWFVSGLAFSILIVQLMAPNLPQFLDFLRVSVRQIAGSLDVTWWQDAAGALLFGTPWHDWAADNPLSISLSELHGAAHVALFLAGAGLIGGLIHGVRLLWKDPRSRWLLLPILGAPVLFLVHMNLSGMRPYHWYLLLFFPGYLIPLAATLNHLFTALDRSLPAILKHDFRPLPEALRPRITLLGGLLAIGFLQGPLQAWWISGPQRRALLQFPIEACRESVALTRTITNPRHPEYGTDSITAGFTMFTEAYDPTLVRFQTVDELKVLMQKARDSKRALYINFSSRAFCEAAYPDLFKLFNDPALFEHIATLHGQFDAATREVLRAR